MEEYPECNVVVKMAPIVSMLFCITLVSIIMIYQLNILETLGSYLLITIGLLLIYIPIIYACVNNPEWSDHVALVLLTMWAYGILYFWLFNR